jgi:hypothetical protein
MAQVHFTTCSLSSPSGLLATLALGFVLRVQLPAIALEPHADGRRTGGFRRRSLVI